MRPRETRAFQDILSALADDSAVLLRKQYALLSIETGQAFRRFLTAALLAFFGMVTSAAALVFLGVALFEWLAVELSSRWLAALAVFGVMVAVAALLLFLAYGLFLRTSFIPRRTIASFCRTTGGLSGGMSDE